MVRAALYIAAQSADPNVAEDAKTAARAQLENQETKLTRILIDWANKDPPQTRRMHAEIQEAIESLNRGAELLLESLERLSPVVEVAADQTPSEGDVSHQV